MTHRLGAGAGVGRVGFLALGCAFLAGCELVSGLSDFEPPAAGPPPPPWLVAFHLDEAGFGTDPVVARDAGPHGFDLDLVYGGNARYVTFEERRGLEWETIRMGGYAGRALTDELFGQLHGSGALTVELVIDLDTTSSVCPRLLHIGAELDDGRLAVCVDGTAVELRLNQTAVAKSGGTFYGARHVVHAVIDVSQGVLSDRARLYIDGLEGPEPPTGFVRPDPTPLALEDGDFLYIGNRGGGDRSNDGRIFFAALYAIALDPQAVMARAALLAENDDLPIQ